jgi:outer membrane protein
MVVCAGFALPAAAQADSFATQSQARSTSLTASTSSDAAGLFGLVEPAGGRKPLTLNDALARVADTAPDVRIALQRAAQQDAQLRRAWALLLPTASLGAVYTHTCTGGEDGVDCADRKTGGLSADQIDQQALVFESLASIVDLAADAASDPDDIAALRAQQRDLEGAAAGIRQANTEGIVVQPASQVNGQLVVNVPLFNPRAYPALQNAYDGVDVARLAKEQAQQGLGLSLVRGYLAAFAAQRLVETAARQVEVTTAQRDVMKARVDGGTQPVLALKRAELERLRAEQSLAQAQAAADNGIAALGTVLGLTEMFTVVDPGDVDVDVDAADVAALADRAVTQRLEVRTQRLALQIAERGTTDAWMQFLPQVGLQASARATSFTQGFVRDPITGVLSISATLPLYDGGVRYAAMHESSARISEERVRLTQIEERVRAQVRGNARDVGVRVRAFALATEALAVAKDAAATAGALFDAGVGTALDVSETQVALFAAETEALRAELDLKSARLGLRWAVGDVVYGDAPP